MTRRYVLLAGTAAAVTYLLIVLGAVVRITGSGMGCGDHWPLCNGKLFPPLDDIGTLIEWSHRLVAAIVSILVIGLAVYAWRTGRGAVGPSSRPAVRLAYTALALLILQVMLGAVTVWLELPPWSVILHLGTAMLLLATLLYAATGQPAIRPSGLLALTFVTVLFGALTANLGAASACGGFPLCNGELIPSAGALAHIHWTHRLLAYALAIAVTLRAVRQPATRTHVLLGLVIVQVALGAATVLMGLPPGMQAAHLAVGTAVWAGAVLAVRPPATA
jgi:heme A synthase